MLHLLRAIPLTLLAAALGAADAAALPQAIPASDPHLHWAGRWDQAADGGPRCEWTSCAVRMTTTATALNVLLAGGNGHAFQVVVDGKPTAVVTIAKDQQVYAVASGLAAGSHVIELFKRTESWGGTVQIRGFQADDGATLADTPVAKRRIEFLGDSITCGYGNEATSEKEHFNYTTENAYMAWGAISARALDAEVAVEAISGIWLQPHPEKADKLPLPARWDRVLPLSGTTKWDFARWQADAVVVNLGTNDMNGKDSAGKPIPIEQEKWSAAYKAFIAQIRTAYPQAHIFLCIGPMGHGKDGILPRFNTQIAEELKAAGDAKVHAVALPNQRKENGLGADWHPSIKTQQLMSDTICAAIRQELGW